MAYLESIIANGRAELGNLSGRDHSGAQIATDSAQGKYFALDADAYMMQNIASVLFSRPSVEYLIRLAFKRNTVKDPLNLLTDAFATIRFRYQGGKEDIITMPLNSQTTRWTSTEKLYKFREGLTLNSIVFSVQTVNALGGFGLDNMEMLPSDNFIESDSGGGNSYEKFKELSILYGLEANLPELG